MQVREIAAVLQNCNTIGRSSLIKENALEYEQRN
jgi:hypothetical protein